MHVPFTLLEATAISTGFSFLTKTYFHPCVPELCNVKPNFPNQHGCMFVHDARPLGVCVVLHAQYILLMLFWDGLFMSSMNNTWPLNAGVLKSEGHWHMGDISAGHGECICLLPVSTHAQLPLLQSMICNCQL
jgi:hypothetical protein